MRSVHHVFTAETNDGRIRAEIIVSYPNDDHLLKSLDQLAAALEAARNELISRRPQAAGQ